MRKSFIKNVLRSFIAVEIALLTGCQGGSEPEKAGSGADAGGRKVVVCTTTMIADLARQLAGDDLQVVGIMKTGTDPHIYDPTPDDKIWFRKADLVLVNGLHLEGKMIDMIEGAGGKAIELAVHDDIKIRESSTSAGAPDPHVWWNVAYFKVFAEQVRDEFKKIDTDNAAAYDQRATAYLAQLDALHTAVKAGIATIPASARYMITSHDAFYYYGEAYGLEVDAVLGISTDAQANAGDQDRLARLCSERKIPAIFHETSVSAAQNELVDGIQRLAKEKYQHDLKVAGPLYSDSLGEPGTEAETYIGSIEANTRMIVESLGGTFSLAMTGSGVN